MSIKLKEQRGASVYSMPSACILKEQHTIILRFKKLYKFMDPAIPKQMSAVVHSVGPQKEL
jgi:hypothetical protein